MKVPTGQEMKKRLEDFESDRARFARTWDLCSLYLQGRQHVFYDKSASDFRRQKSEGSDVTINLLINIFRNLKSRLSVAYPSCTVLPASPSPSDVVKAQTSEAALKYYWSKEQMRYTFEDAISWLITTGNVGLHTRYNGKDICTDVIDPHRMYFEPGATRLDQSSYRAFSKLVDREALIAAYPDHEQHIKDSAEGDSGGKQLRNSLGLNPSKELKNRLKIYEVYYDGGERRVLLGSKFLFKGRWNGAVHPLQLIRFTEIPGRLWGLGALEPLIDLQAQYNRARAQVIDNAELIGNPKWLIPKTAGVGPNSITSRKGEKIYYNPAGGAPTIAAPPQMPGFVLQNISQIASEMMDVSGLHATSLGKRAVGVTSGKAIEELSNKDSTQLQTTQNNIEQAATQLGMVVLLLMKEYYDEGRMVRMLDSLGKVVFKYLKSTEIVEDPEVFIESGTMFRNEKQDRDQKIVDLLQLGLIDKATALTELHFGTGNAFVTERLESIAHANDILEAAKGGMTIEIFPTDDLRSFQDVFSDFIRSPEYYQMPQERQDYLRDILVSIETYGSPDPQLADKLVDNRVFPRVSGNPQEAAKQVVSMESPTAALQQGEQYKEMSKLAIARQMMDGEMNPERGVTRSGTGGGQ